MGNKVTEKKEGKTKFKNDKNFGNINGFTINGKKQKMELTGQDSFDIIEFSDHLKYFGVYDGHGEKGAEASEYIKDQINKSLNRDKFQITLLNSIPQVKVYFDKLYTLIQNNYKKRKNDFELSGSCSVSMLFIEPYIYSINLGDSRGVLGSIKDGKKLAIELTSDHKPNRENESRRIYENGGQVISKHGGVHRVTKKNDDQPGLAVARSVGDLVGHECGISHLPEYIVKEIDLDDHFIVIGSDGVWDIMGSSEVVGFVFDKLEGKKCSKDQISQLLVEECRLRWDLLSLFKEKFVNENIQTKLDDNLSCDIDDITAVIFFPWKELHDFHR